MSAPSAWPSYVLVTPARNEAAHLAATIDGVIAQTVRPLRWVIVDDGSTDATAEVVQRRLPDAPWIELLRLPPRAVREFAAKVRAFEAGRTRLAGLDYAVIGNLDADITLEPRHFERLLARFADDPRLGVAGSPYAEDPRHPERHAYAHAGANLEHVSGDDEDWLRGTIARHLEFTGSQVAERLLGAWTVEVSSFRKVMPRDYKKVLTVMAAARAEGLDEAGTAARVMEASRG